MITKDLIKLVTEEQKNRILGREAGIRRSLLDNIMAKIELKETVVISGVRRSGKSTLLIQILKGLMNTGVKKENILYVNFEDERLDGFAVKDFNMLWEVFLELNNPKEKVYMFLDEIQEVERWEKFVNRMYELEDVKIFITGSNARLLSSEISSLLTGRNITYTLNTFSFNEVFELKNIKNIYDTKETAALHRKLDEYFDYGGFPEVYLKKEKILLGNYVRDIINRDIISRHKIKNIKLFNEFARYVISCYGRYVTYGKLRGVFNLGSVNTAKRYLGFMEDAYLVYIVANYSSSMSEVVKSPRKIYASDHGLGRYFSLKSSEDKGAALENIVFLELKRRQNEKPEMEIYYWKDPQQREVDFVVKEGINLKELIQVCWDVENLETREREVKALLKATEQFKINEGLIITREFSGEERIDEKNIWYVPVWKWLLGI